MRCSVKCAISERAEKKLTRCLSAVAELLVSMAEINLNFDLHRLFADIGVNKKT